MHVDALPIDLLALILGLIPAPLRLHHASLASKRWRAAALRATTSLASPRDVAQAARLLPCLQHLHIKHGPEADVRWDELAMPALRSVTCDFIPPEQPGPIHRFLARTSLTSVELLSRSARLLDVCAASLTACELTVCELPLTLRTDLPRLTSLTLRCRGLGNRSIEEFEKCRSALMRLLSATHTQLASLKVDADDRHLSAALFGDMASLPFPRLTHITAVLVFKAFEAAALTPLLQRCHPSVALSLTLPLVGGDHLDCLALLLPWLAHLSLWELPAHPSFASLLASATRLASLELTDSDSIEVVALDPALASKLTHLGLPQTLPHMHLCTRLATLTIPFYNRSDFAHVSLPTLPSLTALRVIPVLTLQALRQILHSFPHLRTLEVQLSDVCTPQELQSVADAHAQLEQWRLIARVAHHTPLRLLCARRCVILLQVPLS